MAMHTPWGEAEGYDSTTELVLCKASNHFGDASRLALDLANHLYDSRSSNPVCKCCAGSAYICEDDCKVRTFALSLIEMYALESKVTWTWLTYGTLLRTIP